MDVGEMEKHLLEEAKTELQKWEVRAPVGNIEIISAFMYIQDGSTSSGEFFCSQA